MLSSQGYILSSDITTHTLSRYSFRGSYRGCQCLAHDVAVFEQHVYVGCACGIRVLGITQADMIFETSAGLHKINYKSERARPMRVPEGYKFIALKSDTGTGKTYLE